MDYQFRANAPYPDINIAQKSIYEVRLLKPAYAGRVSETTASMEYMYQHYVLYEKYEEIADVLEEIAIVEMTHQEMLGKAIVQLGGCPIISDNYKYWQGSYVNYATDVKTIIDCDIINEKKAIADYVEIVRMSKCEDVKTIIKRIILDEEIHVKTLCMIKESLK
ncbi:MAG: ferritin family protein [Clostridia bacterium]